MYGSQSAKFQCHSFDFTFGVFKCLPVNVFLAYNLSVLLILDMLFLVMGFNCLISEIRLMRISIYSFTSLNVLGDFWAKHSYLANFIDVYCYQSKAEVLRFFCQASSKMTNRWYKPFRCQERI